MSEEIKEIPDKEVDASFKMQLIKVINTAYRSEFYKLKVKIQSKTLSQGEMELEFNIPYNGFNAKSVIRELKEMYELYTYSDNAKISEGAKEEILRLIAVLIWMLG